MVQLVFVLLNLYWMIDCSLCLSCSYRKDGTDYAGTKNVTKSGKPCLRWSESREPSRNKHIKPEDYQTNFCRNPDRSSKPWCFVSSFERENCDIPMCRVNPDARYCVPIPKKDFKVCPMLHQQEVFFNKNILKDIVFCCLSNHTDPTIIPIINNCLLVIIKKSTVQYHYLPCPSGYASEGIVNELLESNIMYKCCRHEPTESTGLNLENINRLYNREKQYAFASLSNKNGLCEVVEKFTGDTVEYVYMSFMSEKVFPDTMTICFYRLANESQADKYHTDLGFLSNKCPTDFLTRKSSAVPLTRKIDALKLCLPKRFDFIYPNGNYCLMTRSSSGKCPNGMSSYQRRVAPTSEVLIKLCCFQSKQNEIFMDSFLLNKELLVIFKRSKDCPFVIGNATMTSFSFEITMVPFKYFHISEMSVMEVCGYETLIDEFAYLKIGDVCPINMLSTWILFKSDLQRNPMNFNPLTKIEYCVGNSMLHMRSFPNGTYCLYKIGSHCPPGFHESTFRASKEITNKSEKVPDYENTTLCCRQDGSNSKSNDISQFPFLGDSPAASFGLRMTGVGFCPNISKFYSSTGIDDDGIYCAYHYDIESPLPKNVIYFPSYNSTKNYTQKNIQPLWKPLRNLSYSASALHVFPKTSFCVLCKTCQFIQTINFGLPYVIKDLKIFCNLNGAFEKSLRIANSRKAPSQLIGLLAVKRLCPEFDENTYKLDDMITDEFEILERDLDSLYAVKLAKIGLSLEFTYVNNTAKLRVPFCIYKQQEAIQIREKVYEFGFLKPLKSVCPAEYKMIISKVNYTVLTNANTPSKHYIICDKEKEACFIHVCILRKLMKSSAQFEKLQNLCSFSTQSCSPDTKNFTLSTNPEDQMKFTICCSANAKEQVSLPSTTFALPLKFWHKYCPKLENYYDKMWNITVLHSSKVQILFFCSYIPMTPFVPWPKASYFTIPYQRNCPAFFSLVKTKTFEICQRNSSETLATEFPEGDFCILAPLDKRCPKSGFWQFYSEIIAYGDNSYFMCCSQKSSLIINLPPSRKNTTFAFLSVERCSLIVGMQLSVKHFQEFKHIVQCVYITDCSDDDNNGICATIRADQTDVTENNTKKGTSHSQAVIIILLLSILVLLSVTSAIAIYGKLKKSFFRSNNQVGVSAFYSVIDSTYEKVSNETEEQTPSVTYSTLS